MYNGATWIVLQSKFIASYAAFATVVFERGSLWGCASVATGAGDSTAVLHGRQWHSEQKNWRVWGKIREGTHNPAILGSQSSVHQLCCIKAGRRRACKPRPYQVPQSGEETWLHNPVSCRVSQSGVLMENELGYLDDSWGEFLPPHYVLKHVHVLIRGS